MDAAPGAKAFTGLEIGRFLCAFAVILYHYSHFFVKGVWVNTTVERSSYPFYSTLGLFYEHGLIAVPIFWMISGLIFFWKYESAVADRALSSWRFFVLRFSRLYPLHFATLVAVTILQELYILSHNEYFIYGHNDRPHFLNQLMLASNWFDELPLTFDGPIWSVSVEVLVYALFFAAVRFQKPGLALCLWVALLAYAVDHVYRQNLFACIEYFFVGGAIVKLVSRLNAAQSRILLAICAAGAVGIGATRLDNWTAIVFAFCFVTACVLMTHAFNVKLVGVAKLGNLTYASYLLHFPIQLAAVLTVDRLGMTRAVFLSPIALAAFLGLTFGLAWVVYRAFEMPAQNAIRAIALGRAPAGRTGVARPSWNA